MDEKQLTDFLRKNLKIKIKKSWPDIEVSLWLKDKNLSALYGDEIFIDSCSIEMWNRYEE